MGSGMQVIGPTTAAGILTFVQDVGANGIWKQVRFNSTLENGQGELPGGYEEIAWNNITKQHDVVTDSMGGTVRYNYTNTSLPAGDITIVAYQEPNLASEWPFPHLNGDRSDPFSVRVMHRMYVEGEMIVEGTNPYYFGIRPSTTVTAPSAHGPPCSTHRRSKPPASHSQRPEPTSRTPPSGMVSWTA